MLTRGRRRRKYLSGNPWRKGGFSTTKGGECTHAASHASWLRLLQELCTHEATRGCRVSCFIGHLRRVRPTLCRRARGTRAGKSYDCREAREEVGGGGGGGY